jgi:phosphoglycolate phosphatase
MNAIANQPTLVFDLDGTLVDTADDLVQTLNVVLAAEGVPPVALEHGRNMVGNGARAMLEAALRDNGGDPDGDRLDALTVRFIDHYRDHLADHSRPFPGVIEALDRLEATGWRFAICTNKLEGLSRSLLDQLNLTGRFVAIAGQDTFGFRKPDPRHLTETIALAGGDPRHAIMVGDSHFDIEAAHRANVPVVAVAFGYTATPAQELGATAVIDRYDELFDVATALLDRARPTA